MADAPQMVFLGFGKYVRADRIFAVEPLRDDERGSGARTRVWVEGIPEPLIASRTERAILAEMGAVRTRPRPAPQDENLFRSASTLHAARLFRRLPRRHATVPRPRLPQPVDRPGGLDARRRDRRRRSPVPGLHADALDGAGRPARPRLAGPAARRAARRRRDRRRARPPHASCCAPRPAWRSSPRCFLVNSLLPHPQVWALFVLQALAVAVFSLGRPAMSSLTPRLVPDDQIAAASALDERLQLARRRRRAGRRRRARSRSPASRGRTASTSRRTSRRSSRSGAAEAAAARRGRPAEPALDRRRLPLPQGPPGADRDLRSSTRTRWSSECRARSSRRSRCTASAATQPPSASCTPRHTPAR